MDVEFRGIFSSFGVLALTVYGQRVIKARALTNAADGMALIVIGITMSALAR